MSEIQIPQFQKGEHVLFHAQAIEDRCPLCGYIPGSAVLHYDEVVVILGKSFSRWFCWQCYGTYEQSPEGWWNIKGEKTPFCGAPYTLLERIN